MFGEDLAQDRCGCAATRPARHALGLGVAQKALPERFKDLTAGGGSRGEQVVQGDARQAREAAFPVADVLDAAVGADEPGSDPGAGGAREGAIVGNGRDQSDRAAARAGATCAADEVEAGLASRAAEETDADSSFVAAVHARLDLAGRALRADRAVRCAVLDETVVSAADAGLFRLWPLPAAGAAEALSVDAVRDRPNLVAAVATAGCVS